MIQFQGYEQFDICPVAQVQEVELTTFEYLIDGIMELVFLGPAFGFMMSLRRSPRFA